MNKNVLRVDVQLGPRSYPIEIGTRLLSELGSRLTHHTEVSHAVIITDDHVLPHARRAQETLAAQEMRVDLCSITPGERSKSVAEAARLWQELLRCGTDRKSVVVAVGGGVVGDLAGFLAATYARGLRFCQVPTSLLAQVDSSVGGKVGINLPSAKNMVGAFWQPTYVLIDTEVLATLPDREYWSGLAEVIKYGVILDQEFFDELERNADALQTRQADVLRQVVARCCRLKADVVEADECEQTGRRAVLNFGHTFAHALEAVAGYGELLHGEAVAIGMICAARLSEELGRTDARLTGRLERLLQQLHLPTRLPPFENAPLIQAMQSDKKVEHGRLRFVLPSRLGHVELVPDVEETAIRQALERLSLERSAMLSPREENSELLAAVGLNLVPGVGPRTCRALRDRFGSLAAAWAASAASLREVPRVGPQLAERIVACRATQQPHQEIERCHQAGIELRADFQAGYPRLLAETPDPPSVIYVRGSWMPCDALAVALVGTRHATHYGLRQAERLAAALARCGLTVISGMARGIDAAAHRAAMAAGGRTIGVLAGSLLRVYPPEHMALAEQICDQGALVGEGPLECRPRRGSFPRRNRVISGLSLGVVVVEASLRSGALITARHALEQGREVFAVPGRVDHPNSRGCHRLLRDGAKLVETVADVLEELGPLVESTTDRGGSVVCHPAELQLNEQERAVLDAIELDPTTVEKVVVRSRLPVARVLATLSVLEMRHLIRRLSGDQVVRVV